MQDGHQPKGGYGPPRNPPARTSGGRVSAPRLPSLRTPEGLVETLDEWKDFARRDDCLGRMVPSDLRVILSNLT